MKLPRVPSDPSSSESEEQTGALTRAEAIYMRGHELRSTVPPSGSLTSLDMPLVLPEHTFFERLDELTRQMEMMTALLQAGGLSRIHGSRAAQAVLGSLAASAEESNLHRLGSFSRALCGIVGELVDEAAVESSRTVDVLLFDSSEISRDLVAVAVAAQGHLVRCARRYDEFVALLGERLPDLIITDVAHDGVPPRQFCVVLAELLQGRRARLVLFSALARPELEGLKTLTGAHAAISKDVGVPALVAELGKLLRPGQP